MRIPSSFPLFGKTINVTVYSAEEWPHSDDCVGLWQPSSNRISIHARLRGADREQALFHEMIHAILDGMSHKLARNEVFVDQFASLLHQALTGARYASKPKVL